MRRLTVGHPSHQNKKAILARRRFRTVETRLMGGGDGQPPYARPGISMVSWDVGLRTIPSTTEKSAITKNGRGERSPAWQSQFNLKVS